MKYHLVQHGCQMNQSDGQRVAAMLEAMGYDHTEDENQASILGIIACSVRQKAIDKVYNIIAKWNKQKEERHLLTFVSGCVLDEDREQFLDRFDLVFSMAELPQLPDMIVQYGVTTPFAGDYIRQEHAKEIARISNTAIAIKEMQTQLRQVGGGAAVRAKLMPSAAQTPAMGGFWDIRPNQANKFAAYVPIQNGCDKFCSFCAVPYTRGRELSRPSSAVLAEIADLVERGYRSITLLGQNVNSYGLDRASRQGPPEMDFVGLLQAIGELGNRAFAESGRRFWVYFTSPHPRDMDSRVFQTIANYDCLAKQIHLPLQSGDDHVLMRMNRKHTMERYRGLVADIRRILPSATLYTDIIVGFSGETEEQFQNTRLAMEEFDYTMAYVAMYSPRPGAASSRWEDDIPKEEKNRRLQVLSEVLHQSGLALNQKEIGRVQTVLVEGFDSEGGFVNGRNEGKIQVRFPLPQALPNLPAQASDWIGRFVQVRIESVKAMSMAGSFAGFGWADGSARD